MIKSLQNIHPFFFILICTALEVAGDTIIRKSMFNYGGVARAGLMIAGAALLFGYGFFLNMAPVSFGRIVGLYIATLFVVWQAINYIAFHTLPSAPILVGGGLVISGGLIITFWKG